MPLRSKEAAKDILEQDMFHALASVRRLIVAPLTPEQEAALVDFVFNCGAGNLQVSTLRRFVNREEHDEAPAQIRRWVYAGGIRLRRAGQAPERRGRTLRYFLVGSFQFIP